MTFDPTSGARRRLYEASEMLDVGDGEERVSVCVCRASASGERRRRLVLIHGNPSQLDHWSPLLPALRQHGDVLAFDHPGFGRSEDFADAAHSLERSARLVQSLLDANGWTEPVDVVGQSHGGLVAIALAALAPERVASIIGLGSGGTPAHPAYRALASSPRMANIMPMLARAFFRPRALRPLARFFVRNGSRAPFAPAPPLPWVVDDQVNDLAQRPEALRAMVRLTLDDPCGKVSEHARRLTVPTLFIHGASDALVNVHYARRLFDIVATVTTARFVEVAGGHMVHMTHPELVKPALDEWFAAQPSATSAGRLVG